MSQIIRVPQNSETPVTSEVHGTRYALRYAYSRAAESQSTDALGQDYLGLDHGDDLFVFALCDGVGQSFFGELAARFLGDALVEWFRQLPQWGLSVSAIQSNLTEHLNALTGEARSLVERQRIPSGTPKMLRQVLEEKRRLGSETMFVAGRLDLSTPELPDGRLLLVWAGDSRLRLFPPEGNQVQLSDHVAQTSRWSTHRGLIGDHVGIHQQTVLREGRAILKGWCAYTDGLHSLDGYPACPSDSAVSRLIHAATYSSVSDDIAFLEVALGSYPDRWRVELLVQPHIVEAVSQAGQIRLSWQKVPGATSYEIESEGAERRRWTTRSSSPLLEVYEAGQYQFRVRAVADGMPGEWSDPLSVRVPVEERTLSSPVEARKGGLVAPSVPLSQEARSSGARRRTLLIGIACFLLGALLTALVFSFLPDLLSGLEGVVPQDESGSTETLPDPDGSAPYSIGDETKPESHTPESPTPPLTRSRSDE